MLNIQIKTEEDSAVVKLEGRLDTVSAPDLSDALNDVIPRIKDLILDLSGLDYISSAGLRVLLAARKAIPKEYCMKLIHVNDDIMGILETTRFTDILSIEQ